MSSEKYVELYEKLEVLGCGGYGTVHKIKEIETGKIYASKEIDIGSQKKERLDQEVKVLKQLDHPNIVKLHKTFYEERSIYLVMDYISGGTLNRVIQKGGMDEKDYKNYLEQILEGMCYVHSQGIIHRDIKPCNILLNESDQIYISDFGIAKFVEHGGDSITETGDEFGTPQYMSIEQMLDAKSVTFSSDIYSLGTVMYEMITGSLPFTGTSKCDLFMKKNNDKIKSPAKLNSSVSKYVSNVCMKALEKNPQKRFQSCEEFLYAFQEAVTYEKKSFINVILGSTSLNGFRVRQSSEETIQWFEKAASKGDIDAMWLLGCLYRDGEGVKQNYEKAIQWFEKAASKGDIDAMYSLGYLYYDGEGVKQNYEKAIQWFEEGASEGYIDAMVDLGFMYQNGLGVEQNYDEGVKWYKKSAELGNSDAMVNLGFMYCHGYGVEQSYEEGLKLYREEESQGNSDAIYFLGRMYYYGYRVEQNYEEAIQLCEKAASKGNGDAMYFLGEMYYNGYGVKQNYEKAIQWYEEAISVGNKFALIELGKMYSNGEGVEEDKQKAKQLYRIAVVTEDT